MKIFVIGGTGFIGGHAVRAIAAAGHEVTSLARSAASEARLRVWGVEAIAGDVSDLAVLARGIDAADAVVFAAAVGQAENGVVGWILDRMEGSGKSLIFCSGTGVLGERTAGAWSENTFSEWDEFTPSRSLASRAALEMEVRAASSRGLARGMVVRPPAVWTHETPHRLVSSVLQSVRRTGAACYIGEGLNMYSYIHAEDLGEVFRHCAERGQDGAVYHAVAGETPNRWIAEMVSRLTGAPTRSITMDDAIELWGKFDALVVFGVSSRSRSPRSRQEFGWAPRHTDMLAAAEASVRKMLEDEPLES
jgi:nucleoside-diphosphate-sugar epimerase